MHMALYIRIGSHTIQTKTDGTISVSILRQDGTWGLPNLHLPLAVTNCNLEPEHFGHRVYRGHRHNYSRPSHIRCQSSRILAKVLHPLQLLNTEKWRTFQLTLDLTRKAGTRRISSHSYNRTMQASTERKGSLSMFRYSSRRWLEAEIRKHPLPILCHQDSE